MRPSSLTTPAAARRPRSDLHPAAVAAAAAGEDRNPGPDEESFSGNDAGAAGAGAAGSTDPYVRWDTVGPASPRRALVGWARLKGLDRAAEKAAGLGGDASLVLDVCRQVRASPGPLQVYKGLYQGPQKFTKVSLAPPWFTRVYLHLLRLAWGGDACS